MAESIVDTTGGRFRGVHFSGVRTFLGIRYGAAPVGDRRFRASVAQPAHAGVRDAFAFGASAVQLDARLRAHADDSDAARLYFSHAGQTEGAPTSEDCLTLNVWSPAREGAGLPVIVWVHGGAFRAGSASAVVTDGEQLAATGRVVVVSVAHRLGALGFTALPDVAGSGYAGLTDIVLALEWVRDNVAVFGGDPSRVTVAGQSGGGVKVAALLRMPRARGLFRSCVVQSPGGRVLSAEEGAGQTRMFLAGARNDGRSIRAAPIASILAGQAAVSAEGFGPSPVADGEGLIDGDDSDLMPDVSMLVGSTVHDWSLLVAGQPWYAELDRGSVPQALAQTLPFAGPDVLERYRDAAGDESAPLFYSRIMADHSFGAAADHLAESRAAQGSAVFHYRFAHETTELPALLGATHCLEIPFVFRTTRWSALAGAANPELETAVSDAWITFAESGSPGPRWRPYVPSGRASMTMDSREWAMTSREDPRGRRGVFQPWSGDRAAP